MTAILYKDDQVTIYKELIVINKYYFPLATSKSILISDIQMITIHSLESVTHRWGICGKYLNNWFPYDANRKNKKKFIEFILKGKKIRSSITPDDPDLAFKVLRQNFTVEGQQEKAKDSELGYQENVTIPQQSNNMIVVPKNNQEMIVEVEDIS